MKHGGKRPGAGRPPLPDGAVRKTITLSQADLEYLRSLDANISKAVRLLIAAVRKNT